MHTTELQKTILKGTKPVQNIVRYAFTAQGKITRWNSPTSRRRESLEGAWIPHLEDVKIMPSIISGIILESKPG
jgi:hypothetical protein